MIPVVHVILFGTALFVLGLLGFLIRKNVLVMLLSAELMLTGVNVILVAFAQAHGTISGQTIALFALLVGMVQIAVGMAVLLLIYRRRGELNPASWERLRDW